MNWTVDNNGAYDYTADTRGFTFATMLECHERRWAVRFAEALMPKVANGIHLDADMSRARAENIEFELHGTMLRHQEGTIRFLSFINHANMGSYREAIGSFLSGLTLKPDITAHPLHTAIKYGFGLNFEQPLDGWMGAFGRWGWDEGRHESFAYTEVDQTADIGLGGKGKPWHRKFDRAGLQTASRETTRNISLSVVPVFFSATADSITAARTLSKLITRCMFGGDFILRFCLQHINNPGYHQDRGPVVVPTLRLHLEF